MPSSHKPIDSARLIVDPPASGSWNMAVDQTLLNFANENRALTLRFYRWQEPTLSLGYFQKLAQRNGHAASLACPIIRRASGGGAIVHDDELTYSLCMSENCWSGKSSELYDLAHNAIRDALAQQDIDVNLYEAPTGETVKASSSDPFLCFQRRAVGDLICNENKIGGSAQRRLKSALIQHGSLQLSRSKFAPELPGLAELNGKTVCVEKLINSVESTIATALECTFEPATLRSAELKMAADVELKTFQSQQWLGRR